MSAIFTTFTNCRICVNGELLDGENFVISEDTGLILESTGSTDGKIVDLNDAIISPGFLELHTNGVNGFHFTSFEDEKLYGEKLEQTARFYVTKGITGFWATIPTVSAENYQKVRRICCLLLIICPFHIIFVPSTELLAFSIIPKISGSTSSF
jgi:N-acetylglucosamine-6-phosphate deacetylase